MCDACNKFNEAMSRYRELLKQRFDPLIEARVFDTIGGLARPRMLALSEFPLR
jgi:hypothetical protein